MLGVQTDNVDELRAQMAPLAAEVVLAGAGEEVAEDQAHLLARDVVAATGKAKYIINFDTKSTLSQLTIV